MEADYFFPVPSQTSRQWIEESLRQPDRDQVRWKSDSPAPALAKLKRAMNPPNVAPLDGKRIPSLLEQRELAAIMRPSSSSSRTSLSSSTGSLTSRASGSNIKRKPSRTPSFAPRPVTPAGEDTMFSHLSRQVAEMVDQNQRAKQRAEAKKLAKDDKGKQRAAEPLPKTEKKSAAPPRPRPEELLDRTNVATDTEDSWEADLGEASLMDVDVDVEVQPPRRPVEKPKPAPKKPPVVHSSHTNTTSSRHVSAQPKQPSVRPTSAVDVRRTVSAPQDTTSKPRPPALQAAAQIHQPRPKAQPTHARAPSPPKPSAQPVHAAPPATQSRKPPALGMRRTNTHPGVNAAFRPSQELPTKQRGFKPPFAHPPSQATQPPASFPVPQRTPSPPAAREASPVPVVEDPDSSYGDISLDMDTIEEIMSQFDKPA